MPRPIPPPTPASSSDIRAKEGSISNAPSFNLPPTAYHDQDRASISSNTPSNAGSDSSYHPMSPAYVPTESRKRPAPGTGVITKEDFALPPPPTRSRKIIQMKPRDAEQQDTEPAAAAEPQRTPSKASAGAQPGGKKKQNSQNTTAAGRKIARKTAHSLIERRRRSKMNEEFGVLKDMIPACKGQDMHKLAILQASIEYLRYLEQCVADLQSKTTSDRPQPPTVHRRADPEEDDDDGDEDEEMEDDPDANGEGGTTTPSTQAGPHKSGSMVSLPSLSQITTTTLTSPSVFSEASRHYSISSASQASYSPYFHSTHTSPAFGPQLNHVSTAPQFSNTFGLGSPALKPVDSAHHLRQIAEGASDLSERQRAAARKSGRRSEHELDQEATAALLMLNNDRRQWRSGYEGQDMPAPAPKTSAGQQPPAKVAKHSGMSVRDLLSG